QHACTEDRVREVTRDSPYLRRALELGFTTYVCAPDGGDRVDFSLWSIAGGSDRPKRAPRSRAQYEDMIRLGDFAGFETCLKNLKEDLETNQAPQITYAYIAECAGLEALLYGTETERVDSALKIARENRDDEPGSREVLIGKAALKLSRLG